MKYILILVLLAFALTAAAEPQFFPQTTIIEDFAAIWCVTCLDAIAGLDVIHSQHHNGELFSVRYYTTSGELSNPEVDARFEHYEVYGVPSVFFNGKSRIDGGGAGIVDGSTYINALKPYLYHASPLKMDITGFTASSARVTGLVKMLSPTFNIQNQKLFVLLLEDDVEDNATHVVRSIHQENFSLTGLNAEHLIDHTFTLNPAWDTNELWVCAFVQMDDDAILQSASNLPLPSVNLRAAMEWNPDVVVLPNSQHESQPVWFFNLGDAQDYQIRIVVDSAPADWMFNYCDEDNNCYPGSVLLPFSLQAGERKNLHLNIIVGSSGIANFYWEITSAALGTYTIPFRYRTNDVSNVDESLVSNPVNISRAYPNPFRNHAIFEIESDKALSGTRIDIYNLKGQVVKSLPVSTLTAGSNSIRWDLSPQETADLGNGVYFYRLEASGKSSQGKLLLIK